MTTPSPLSDTELGKRIKQKRWESGLTQADLADKIGVSAQQIQKYESGTNRVSATLLYAIALSVGAEITFFFEGT